MDEIPSDLRYTDEHEWVQLDDDGNARVGITDYAQAQLGDVVYVELPTAGDTVRASKAFGVVESVKAASDLYSPLTGTVVGINDELTAAPERINDDPYGDGWMVVIAPEDEDELDALLDAEAYRALVEEEQG